MTEFIPNPAGPDHPGYAVESDEAAGSLVLDADADGVRLCLAPEAARRIGKELLQAAGGAEFKSRMTDGGGSATDD